ncbi:hypothetical protein [Cohnella zeiphila]|uniref:Uncharacterized protein n=1 Tax=Cohnella zeiphila TaxID=2761120 RepID=A0A7X0SPU0_9BACL|nr:hypothetical protein [Cohnella zeiphila]MBB6732809.1 hypothetical protein [Cohnella zeiphila]
MKIFENPAMIAASISSCIAFIGIVAQTILSVSKNKNEVRSNFEKLLTEKLREMYSPLQMHFQKNINKDNLIDLDTEILLNSHNHLLSNELLEDILQLIQIEKGTLETTEYNEEEHNSLKEKVIEICKKEFSELQRIQNRHFYLYKKRFNTKWWVRLGFISFVFSASVAILYWLIILAVPSGNLKSDPHYWWNILGYILGIMVLGGTLMLYIIGVVLIITLFEYIKYKFRKMKTSFTSNDYVPKTGMYQCTICHHKVRKIRNKPFGECFQKHGWIRSLIAFPTIYTWKLVKQK